MRSYKQDRNLKVLGTAGHVDHGKSTLVLALTGIDPDRLAEEKAREMTIDLGFAWLTLPDGEQIGVIDVPGHIDFIKNMLAGVGGIDAALFVIAADEGVMPQTREHLAILDLLQINAGIVALTKVDMVAQDPDWLELVEADVADALDGTVLEDAPVVRVSARTGAGLERLRQVIAETLRDVPERRNVGRPRLPVDRAFSISGFGTVVTGTLSDGALEVGQDVELVPSGRKARVRGLQTHKTKIQQALPGSRVAVNLSGISKDEVPRGDVVGLPGDLTATVLVDVHLRMIADSSLPPLRHNQPVDFFVGAAEVPARSRLLDAEAIGPGEWGWVQLRLERPIVAQRGDRFILRQASPSRTIGGGVVVNPFPGRRWRRFRPEVTEMLAALESGDPAAIIVQTLRRSGPTSAAAVLHTSGLQQAEGLAALAGLVDQGRVVILDRGWPSGAADDRQLLTTQTVMEASAWEELAQRMERALASYHRQNPLRQGMSREELKSRLQGRRKPLPPRAFNDMLARATTEGLVVDEGAAVRLPLHNVRLEAQQQASVDALLGQFSAAPFAPPSVAESVAMVGEDVFLWLVDSGQLVRVSDDVVFSPGSHQQMVDGIVAFIQREGSMTVAQVRDQFGTSRKYALALLEDLDTRRITRRVGDARVLRAG